MNKWELLNELYINKGLKIFPIEKNGKKPLINAWQKECSSDIMQVLYWYENAKDCNWGLPATPNDLFVIDLDVHDENKNGIHNFEKLLEDIGCDGKLDTLVQMTQSGGLHIIYKSDDDLKKIANSSNVFEKYSGIDFRTDGYIVVEPSIINCNMYTFISDTEPQPMPQKLKDYILNNSVTKDNRKKTPYVKPKDVYIGDRDNQLFLYINNLYQKTMLDFDEILLLATAFNDEFEEPFSDRVVRYKVEKAFEKERGQFIIIKLGDDND